MGLCHMEVRHERAHARPVERSVPGEIFNEGHAVPLSATALWTDRLMLKPVYRITIHYLPFHTPNGSLGHVCR